ncbi:MAG: SRPBCC family protein [Bacteroidetes bacterium]|nr:SRPBCC family protein [Bacteroidota bacterium]
MKFVKYFVLVMLSLIATVLTLASLKSPEYKVQRSTVIHAPRAVVWNQISRWKQFNNWNPWAALDSNAVYQFEGNDGALGSSVSWKGNDNIGAGSMRTWRVEPMKSVDAELKFTAPWESTSNTRIEMQGDDGQVQVSWTMYGKQSLLERSFTLFMGGMDKMVGKDYEQGLINLKRVCEQGPAAPMQQESASTPVATQQGVPLFEVVLPARKYAGIRNVVTAAQLESGEYLKQSVLSLMAGIAQNGLRVSGSVFVFHYMSDAASGMMDIAVCMPVEIPKGKTAGNLYLFELPQRRALAADQNELQANGGPARRALREYTNNKAIQTEPFTVEEYLFDPLNSKKTDAIKTRQYVLLP